MTDGPEDFSDLNIIERIAFVLILAVLVICAALVWGIKCAGTLPAKLFQKMIYKMQGYESPEEQRKEAKPKADQRGR